MRQPLRFVGRFVRDRLYLVQVATVLGYAGCLAVMAVSGFRDDVAGQPLLTDHRAFHSAARLITEGRGARMYDYDFMDAYQKELYGPDVGLVALRTPPFFAVLYVPTARLPLFASYWVWALLSAALVAWVASALAPDHPVSALLWALSFGPVAAIFTYGQNSAVSLALFCGTFLLLERGRPFLAGLVAGLLLFKPQLLLGLGLWWVLDWRRYWPAILGGLTAALLLAGLSVAVVPEETREFIRRLGTIAGYNDFWFHNNHTPRGFGTLLARDDVRFGDAVALLAGVAAVAYFVAFWRRHRDDLPAVYAAAVVLTLWASPHTMIYEWSIALIPALLLWQHFPDERGAWLPLFAAVWLVMPISAELCWLQQRWTNAPSGELGPAVQLSVPVVAVVAVLIARRLDRRGLT